MPSKKAPDPIDVHVGTQCRTRRLLSGLSQTKVATGLGITFQQVQKYEKGTNRIAPSRLVRMAVLYGCTVADFFDGAPAPKIKGRPAPEPQDTNPLVELGATSDGLKLAAAFVAIEDLAMRHSIVAIAQAGARQQ